MLWPAERSPGACPLGSKRKKRDGNGGTKRNREGLHFSCKAFYNVSAVCPIEHDAIVSFNQISPPCIERC